METEDSSSKEREATQEQPAQRGQQSDHDGQYAGGEDQHSGQHGHQAAAITPPPELPAAPPRRALMTVGFFVLVLVAAGILVMILRIHGNHVLADTTEQNSIPTVAIVHPTAEKPDEELVLPGTLQAYTESPIYARTNGYLLRWYKDIGSKVKKGDLLADIDTPEVDQELMQARATRQQIIAQLDLAKINANRYETLRKTDSVSQEEADQQKSGYEQAQANLAAADANVRRLEQTEGFKRVYAPFSGVLTRRTVDPGALINAGVAGAAGKELFDIAQTDPLRVYVNVPQAYAPAMKPGIKAMVSLQELPGQKFEATVTRTADSIDVTTRTLLTEVDVPNKDGKLLPGSFGEVHFTPKIDGQKVTVPVNAMLFRSQGAQVGLVDANGKVHLQPITIGRDYGATLEVVQGVDVNDQVIVNPSDSLEEGQQVHIAPSQPGQGAKPQGEQKS